MRIRKRHMLVSVAVAAAALAFTVSPAEAAMELNFGTSGGNKTATEMHVGTASGNKQVTEGWVGTAGGNKQWYGAGFTPVTRNYDGGVTGTETVPTGATSCRIRIWGGGGGGGKRANGTPGYGGTAGAFSEKTVSVSGGDTINYEAGTGGTGFKTNLAAGTGNAGTLSRVGNITATGGFAGTSMTANGGPGGQATAAGAASTASGGSTNTNGPVGNNTEGAVGGGSSPSGGTGGYNVMMSYDTETLDWSVVTFPSSGSGPGGGGGGGSYSTVGNDFDMPAEDGAYGRVQFYYT